jgi:hypothetical protein
MAVCHVTLFVSHDNVRLDDHIYWEYVHSVISFSRVSLTASTKRHVTLTNRFEEKHSSHLSQRNFAQKKALLKHYQARL